MSQIWLSYYAVNFDIFMVLQISGTPACVEEAKLAVEDRCRELEADREDRKLKSFKLEVRKILNL
jgi:hypothetical protein